MCFDDFILDLELNFGRGMIKSCYQVFLCKNLCLMQRSNSFRKSSSINLRQTNFQIHWSCRHRNLCLCLEGDTPENVWTEIDIITEIDNITLLDAICPHHNYHTLAYIQWTYVTPRCCLSLANACQMWRQVAFALMFIHWRHKFIVYSLKAYGDFLQRLAILFMGHQQPLQLTAKSCVTFMNLPLIKKLEEKKKRKRLLPQSRMTAYNVLISDQWFTVWTILVFNVCVVDLFFILLWHYTRYK